MPDKNAYNLEILKEVIQVMKEEDVNEVCIEQNGLKIKVKRAPSLPNMATQGMARLEYRGEAAGPPETEDTSDGQIFVPAPMVGTFYRSPSPEAKPYVNVGDEIEVGQVICIIDAMKLMNEITSDLDGEIVEILIEDGQPVEYDQPMFRVKPK
jgi:acetyl-CoA carboxylase biotin carboxyl carrier protein